MGIVFTLISLWYTWISFQTLGRFWRRRATLFDEEVTPGDRALFDRGAFFLLIPLGVLLHEVGHAAATWQVGGDVAVFRWFIFWGYIIPEGSFSALQDWWIGLAGNVVSVVLGLLAIAAVWMVRGRAWRYWLWSFGRLQLFYGLIFYPAFSLLAGFGDWPQIYGSLIGRTELPTGVPELRPWAIGVVVGHVALLAAWWRAERSAGFRQALLARYAPPKLLEQIQQVERVGGIDDHSALAMAYARLGEARLAEETFQKAVAIFPEEAVIRLNWARFEQGRKRADRALALYGEALSLAQDPRLRVLAREGLAHAELEHGRARVALGHLDQALSIQRDDPALRLLRARVRWSLDDSVGAELDLKAAEAIGDEGAQQAAAALRAEMAGG